jgi:hypothetical protein
MMAGFEKWISSADVFQWDCVRTAEGQCPLLAQSELSSL